MITCTTNSAVVGKKIMILVSPLMLIPVAWLASLASTVSVVSLSPTLLSLVILLILVICILSIALLTSPVPVVFSIP